MENMHEFAPSFNTCYSWYRPEFRIHDFSDVERNITCVAPLLCAPSIDMEGKKLIAPTRHALWLDSNILSFAKNKESHKGLTAMFKWAHDRGMLINPILAVIEQYNNPIPESESRKYVLEKINLLNERYDSRIDLSSLDHILPRAKSAAVQNKEYVEILADYFILVRHFHHSSLSFEDKCIALATLTRDHLPQLVAAYHVACLYFYVKENLQLFKGGETKCQTDMKIPKDAEHGRKLARNFAFDFSMITSASWPVCDENHAFLIPYIATGDRGLAFLLKALCFSGINYEGTRSFPLVQFRPSNGVNDSLNATVEIGRKIINPLGVRLKAEQIRRKKLSKAADAVLQGTFDAQKIV